MTNPFDVDDDDNPFAGGDPIAPAISAPPPSPAPAPSPLPAAPSEPAPFNPFGTGASSAAPEPIAPPPAPASTRSAQGGYRDATGHFHSFADMDHREDELRKREAHLADLEEQIRNGTYERSREKNFPPYLHWWAWHPERDLPPDALVLMKRLRVLFMSLFLVYIVNVVGCAADLIGGESRDYSPTMSLVLSIVYAFVLVPLSFELSFFPMYRGILRGAALRFFCGMGVYVVWFLVLAFTVIGVGGLGSVGFIVMSEMFGDSGALGVIGLIFCILGCIAGVDMVLGIIALVRYYRANGLVAKAKQEGTALAIDYAKEHPDQALDIAKAVA
jgi:hypothetical protein